MSLERPDHALVEVKISAMATNAVALPDVRRSADDPTLVQFKLAKQVRDSLTVRVMQRPRTLDRQSSSAFRRFSRQSCQAGYGQTRSA